MAAGYFNRSLDVPASGNGDALPLEQIADKWLHIFGTWNSAVLKLQITVDGTNWFDHSAMTALSADSFEEIQQAVKQVRLVVVSGSGHSLTALVRGFDLSKS